MLRTAVVSLVIALMGGAALWRATDGLRAFTAEEARRLSVLEQPRPVPGIRLIDMRDQPLTLADTNGRAVVVEFIYTTCPTLCVALGESFAILRDEITAAGLSDRTRLISISFDLARDGPEALRDYASLHGADGQLWVLARPENAQALQALLNTFGIVAVPDGAGGFVHNAALHVVSREGVLKAIFSIGEEAQVLAALRRDP